MRQTKYSVREIAAADYPLLEDFLYHAIYIPQGEERPPRDIIFDPEIYVYIKDFGEDTDCGVVAEVGGRVVGAAWTRIIPAYGNLDESTPELAISVLPEWRGMGVGAGMMHELFALLRKRGFARTSLSVQQDNPAVRLYQRLGYVVTDEKVDHAGHDDYIMVKWLGEQLSDRVQAFILRHNLQADVQTRYIDLVAEIGELGKEILTSTDYGKREFVVTAGMIDEMGDCLFSLLALCYEMGVDAHAALDGALAKYGRRFAEKGRIGSEI